MDSTSLTRGHIRHLCAVTSPQDVFMNLTCAPNDLRVKHTARPVCAAFVSCVTVCMCVCVCVCVPLIRACLQMVIRGANERMPGMEIHRNTETHTHTHTQSGAQTHSHTD